MDLHYLHVVLQRCCWSSCCSSKSRRDSSNNSSCCSSKSRRNCKSHNLCGWPASSLESWGATRMNRVPLDWVEPRRRKKVASPRPQRRSPSRSRSSRSASKKWKADWGKWKHEYFRRTRQLSSGKKCEQASARASVPQLPARQLRQLCA